MAVLGSPVQIWQSTPVVTRAFTAATLACSLLYFWLSWQLGIDTPWLTLIPGESYFFPWVLLTSCLVETTIIELAVTLLFVPPSLRYLERLWGAAETLKFIAFTVTISNIIAFALNWIEFIGTRNADLFLYGMEYHGQMALQIGILVAFTQLIPEHHVQILGVIKCRVKTLPMAYVTLSTVLCLIGYQCPYIVIQFGFLFAWIWLRFYKRNIDAALGGGYSYGDRSETFAVIYWFPPFLHGPIGWLGNTLYVYANRYHLIPTSSGDVEANGFAPGGTRAEAERRRQMALKALDQRVAGAAPTKPAAAAAPPETEEGDIGAPAAAPGPSK
ncbi:unnamed protein product [Peniophora sp. CBMAI 1063]|nr:unnamed protein product [Peniophora sp. CBMAI 1063]